VPVTPDTLRFVLQVVAIALGGGSVQMAIFLLKRRSELRSLDATAGSTALTSANEYIATLQGGEKAMRDELDKVQARIQAMQREWDNERAELTVALENESRQVARLSGYLARCKADLSVAQSQLEELTHHSRTSAHHGRSSTD
jgi:Skp family chaperone for outer membrane proteins